jgi:hypothetical protein
MATTYVKGKAAAEKPLKEACENGMSDELKEAFRLYRAGKVWSPLDALKKGEVKL